ncbi:ABC transporter permease [Aerococcus sanguinicola]|uniref:ABC transporter permease n=1 Tax=unclassified Aerococcus TaxID=2618060 RepID=UPI0008A199EC|nr:MULTISPECIES: ABC transporter permease [unclassified Aerococcus]MDK6232669.1 ABC transporter permease [Aerococcus sp. UMB10185]MDK6855041.1 ABC transporter permease [Aerococcus sp. UMB7533]MDK8501692.1 ABC transporter permease [Aerococcus sp. UMB1112A]OFN02508.1 ABC transporter permease [Aerococcus sp. HMSC062A02]OHO45697.1 ABC transporter permease [Aerococcus sp. HMSC035B07]
MDLIVSSISQGLMWSILAIGVYLTFRILDIADLSAEGSFPLGAAVCAKLIVSGVHPLVASLAAFLAGLVAGLVNGFMINKMHIPALLSGILTMTGLYSINLRIMGQANIPLLGEANIMESFQATGMNPTLASLIIALIFLAVVIMALVVFMNTEYGLTLRATGDNPLMAEANGVKTDQMKLVGLMLSNGLIALSGAIICQNNGYADIAMGTGTIVIGLAAIIIGEVLRRNLTFGKRLITIAIGAVIYRLIIDFIMQQQFLPVLPSDIKVLSSIALAIILYAPHAKASFQNRQASAK